MLDHSLNIDCVWELSRELNRTTDEAGEVVRAVEKFLNEKCSIGLPCFILAETVDLGQSAWREVCLGYARVSSRFRVVVRTREFGFAWEDEPNEFLNELMVPWASSPREVRLRTFAKIPELLKEIEKEAFRVSSETRTISKTVTAVLGALSKR